MMKKVYIYRILLSCFFTFLVYLTMPVRSRYALGLSDASIFEYFGYAMTRGEIPYQNLFDHKGPIIFFINYLGYILHGEFGIKLIYLGCIFFFFYISILIIRLFSSEKNTIFVLIILFIVFEYFFELGWGIEGYVLPFINYSLYVYLKYFLEYNIKYYEVILVGISFAFVFFTKANMVGLWVIFSLYIIVESVIKKRYKELSRFIILFITGFFVLTLPLLIYLITNGILYEMFYQSFVVNFIYTQNEGIGKGKILDWFIEKYNDLNLILLFFIALILSYKKYNLKVIFYGLASICCIILALLSKRPYLHYLIVLIPMIIPILSVVVDKIKINFTVLLVAIYLVYYNPLQDIKINIENRNQNYFENEEKVARYIKDKTSYDDKIYSHRMQGYMYLESDRLANSKFFFIPSLEDEDIIIEDFKNEFEKDIPKYIIIDERYDYGKSTDEYIKEYVAKNYIEDYSLKTIKVYKLAR